MNVSHRYSHVFLSAFNSGIYSVVSDTLVISQRSQIMSLSVDHHYKNNYYYIFLFYGIVEIYLNFRGLKISGYFPFHLPLEAEQLPVLHEIKVICKAF